MFTYELLINIPHSSGSAWARLPWDPHDWQKVRPGYADAEIPTIANLQAQVKKDRGFVPDWLTELTDPDEYVQVEDDFEVDGTWFCACIEGSENHVLPPLTQRLAYVRKHRHPDGPEA